MKIKLKRGYLADHGEVSHEVNTIADRVTVKPILAGYHYPEGSDLRVAEQVRVWAQLTASEFNRLDYEDYTDLLGSWIKLWGQDEDEKKAKSASESESTSSPKSKP